MGFSTACGEMELQRALTGVTGGCDPYTVGTGVPDGPGIYFDDLTGYRLTLGWAIIYSIFSLILGAAPLTDDE